MAAQHLVVALNKTDLIPEQDRPKAIKKAQKRLGAAFASTRFAGAPMVPVCARPGACAGADGAAAGGAAAGAEGIEELKGALLGMAAPRAAAAGAPLLFAVDHCFAIRGQGTVLTGTVLQVTRGQACGPRAPRELRMPAVDLGCAQTLFCRRLYPR
jgi:selenocysteine-specific elongation factor